MPRNADRTALSLVWPAWPLWGGVRPGRPHILHISHNCRLMSRIPLQFMYGWAVSGPYCTAIFRTTGVVGFGGRLVGCRPRGAAVAAKRRQHSQPAWPAYQQWIGVAVSGVVGPRCGPAPEPWSAARRSSTVRVCCAVVLVYVSVASVAAKVLFLLGFLVCENRSVMLISSGNIVHK